MSRTDDTTADVRAQEAQRLAARGIPVFPLIGKRPLEGGGFHTATTDLARIDQWIAEHPGCNWGMPTGLVSGYDVLDIDGADGLASLETYEAEHGALPLTPVQITGSGGRHYLFTSTGEVRNSVKGMMPGWDTRGDGGYIVVAPSIHPTTLEPYRWREDQSIFDLDPAPWPEHLLGLYRAQARKRTTAPGDRIPDGTQEDTLTRMAGAMRRQGMDYDAILAALKVISETRCDPPVPERNLERIAASVSRYDPADPLIIFAKSDAGNAERFSYVNQDRVIYCAPLKKWYWWDGMRWAPDDTHQIDRLAIEAIRVTGQRAMHMPGGNVGTVERTAKEAMTSWALASESDKRLTDMVKRARGLMAVLPKDLDADPMKLCVLNGVIDLTTGDLLPHDPAYRITKLAPVVYDPDAILPEWNDFLAQTLADKEGLADFLQMAMGYSLTGLTSEEKLFFVYGPAGTGKSTFVEAFKAVLGDYAKTADFDAFIKHQGSGGPRNDIARLNGARYVSSIEVEQGKALAEALVKTISGGDTVAARFLFAESVEFRPSLKLWLVANDAPTFNADDTGLLRRILRIPFDHVVPEDKRDPRIKALITDPLRAGAALLAWAVKGALMWQVIGKLEVPTVVRKDTERYRAEQDGLTGFLTEACDLGPEHTTATADLFAAYEAHWQNYGRHSRERRLTKQSFSKALKTRDLEDGRYVINGKQQRGWLGIGLKPLDWG